MKLVINMCILLGGLLALPSCRLADLVFYEHAPSKKFYASLDFAEADLSAFKSRNILFVVDLKEANRTSYIVWLGMYAESRERSVFVSHASIGGDGWIEEASIDSEVVLATEVDSSGLMKASVKLFNVSGQLLRNALNDGGPLTLRVHYLIEEIRHEMDFELTPRVERQSVFPT